MIRRRPYWSGCEHARKCVVVVVGDGFRTDRAAAYVRDVFFNRYPINRPVTIDAGRRSQIADIRRSTTTTSDTGAQFVRLTVQAHLNYRNHSPRTCANTCAATSTCCLYYCGGGPGGFFAVPAAKSAIGMIDMAWHISLGARVGVSRTAFVG